MPTRTGCNDSTTSLHFASDTGNVQVLRCLLEADKDKNNHRGSTPSHAATEFGHSPVVTELIKIKEDKRERCCDAPLHYTAHNEKLVEAGANKDLLLVKLVEAGANKDRGNENG